MTETELGPPIIAHMESMGAETFQEVRHGYGSPRADLVFRFHGPRLIHVVELKTSLSLTVIEQAWWWRDWANRTSVAVPRFRDRLGLMRSLLKNEGIGLYQIHDSGSESCPRVEEIVAPRLNRRMIQPRLWDTLLHDGTRSIGMAGNANQEYWTPFRQTCENIREFLRDHPDSTMREIIAGFAGHHYSRDATARSCMSRWIRAGVVPGIVGDGYPCRYRLDPRP